jgi:predicted alpha/beta hydrolase family esterase
MPRQLLFIQGAGEGTHDAWDNRLVASLRRDLGPGWDIRYPRMPDEADPSYGSWKPALDRELAGLADGAFVVGHSIGGSLLVHALAATPPRAVLGGLFLVAAPFLGEGGWPDEAIGPHAALGEALPAGVPVFLYHGDADESVPSAHLELYARALPQAVVRRLAGRDHQLNDDLSEVATDIRSQS